MKTQFIWACITRSGVIARMHYNGPLLAAEDKYKLISMVEKYISRLGYSYYNGDHYIKKKRLRVAKVKLTIEEVRK